MMDSAFWITAYALIGSGMGAYSIRHLYIEEIEEKRALDLEAGRPYVPREIGWGDYLLAFFTMILFAAGWGVFLPLAVMVVIGKLIMIGLKDK